MDNKRRGFKVFNSDWTCRNFQYEVGKTFSEDVIPAICSRGFHYCEDPVDCFNYYRFSPENKVAEVIALGDVVKEGNKSCTNKIYIVREIPWAEVLELVNTGKGCTGFRNTGDCNTGSFNSGRNNTGDCNEGHYNTGDSNVGNFNTGSHNVGDWNCGRCNTGFQNCGSFNSGNYNVGSHNTGNCNTGCGNTGEKNTGCYNSGDSNTGYFNSGNYNSGSWNKTDYSNGCFNTVEPKIYLFNKPSEWTQRDWERSKACAILSGYFKNPVDLKPSLCMTDEEMEAHPEAKTIGGYLKKYDTSDYAIKLWRVLSDDDKKEITSLPNFDKEIFKEITGINIDE